MHLTNVLILLLLVLVFFGLVAVRPEFWVWTLLALSVVVLLGTVALTRRR